jgi:signal transduction histidine kinase
MSLVCILLIAIIFGFVSIVFYMYQKKRYAFLQHLEEVKNKYEKEFLNTKLEMQEQNMQHISKELHDNIGQLVSLAKLHLNTIDRAIGTKNLEKIEYSVELLTTALEDMRDISKSLSLELIKEKGLLRAIENQVGQLVKTGRYRSHFELIGNYDFQEEQKEIILFRILQEAINNIIRHAHASTIDIILDCKPGVIQMLIRDNGKGFPVEIFIPGGSGYRHGGGLTNMTSRAALIGADFFIKSVPDNGTVVSITIPINNHHESNLT